YPYPGLSDRIVQGYELRGEIHLWAIGIQIHLIPTVHDGFPGRRILGAPKEVMGPSKVILLEHIEKFRLYRQAVPGTIGQVEGLLAGIVEGDQRKDPSPFRIDIV